MNREAIKKTAVCRYDTKEKVFIVESPLLEICSGIAETKEEAWEIFDDLLQAMYTKYLEGKIVGQYAKRGRPAKHKVNLSCQVKPGTVECIRRFAQNIHTSQGEFIDFLLAYWNAGQQPKKAAVLARSGRSGTARKKSLVKKTVARKPAIKRKTAAG